MFRQEYKRLKFSIAKADYSEQVQNLKNYNRALEKLTKQSLDLAPTRISKVRTYPNFRALQSYAQSLYETLRSGLQCAGGCQEHAVQLRLENRNMTVENEEELYELTPFRVVFTHISTTNWREVDIRYIVDHPKRIPLLSRPNVASPTVGRKQVRFGQLNQQLGQTQNTQSTTATVVHQQAKAMSNSPPERIRNLCEAIYQLQQPQKDVCLGYLLDALQRKHGIYPLLSSTIHGQQQWAAYSLHQVLTHQSNTSMHLTQLDKLRIAVDLSSSVLQLYKTPWLDESWGEEDLYFVQRPGAPPASIYEHPYVYRKISSAIQDAKKAHAQQTRVRVIRNQTLYTLGTLLIEIWYGKSMKELQVASDLDCLGTPGVAWCTAERLVENDLEFEAGKRYSDAVRRCIRCDFDRNDISLDNESFQEAVFDGVVAPLEKTLQQFNSLD